MWRGCGAGVARVWRGDAVRGGCVLAWLSVLLHPHQVAAAEARCSQRREDETVRPVNQPPTEPGRADRVKATGREQAVEDAL